MLNKWRQRLTANQGYTIDQTILIVAIIAILITLIIITIGWQLIGRSSGTKLAAQLRQVEDANGTFYSDQKLWPNQVEATSTANVLLLMNRSTQTAAQLTAKGVDTAKLTNQLPGLRLNTAGTAPIHTIGSGGNASLVTEQVNTASGWGLGTGKFMIVQFAGLPLTEAGEADEAIDGASGPNTGRLVYGTAACLNATANGAAPTPPAAIPTSSPVNVCYAANTIQ